MIFQGLENTPGQESEHNHGGEGKYFVRTLFEHEFSSSLKCIRDILLYGQSSIGEHLHEGDEELYYVISGEGMIQVDGEERRISPGDAVLIKSGSKQALSSYGNEELRIFVVRAGVVNQSIMLGRTPYRPY